MTETMSTGNLRLDVNGRAGAIWWNDDRFELVEAGGVLDEADLVIHPDMLAEGEEIIVDGVRRRVSTAPIPGASASFFEPEADGWWNLPATSVHLLGEQVFDQDLAKALGLQVRIQVRKQP